VNWPPLPSRDWLAAEEPLPPVQVLDWDRWLGPAPWRPYHSELCPQGGWRNYYDFHGGGILEWGSHTVDLCHWAADLDDTQPVEYEPVGGNTGPYSVNCKYANGVKLVMRDNAWDGALNTGSCSFRIEGELGWVETGDKTKIECFREHQAAIAADRAGADGAREPHARVCPNCVRPRKTPSANAAAAAIRTSPATPPSSPSNAAKRSPGTPPPALSPTTTSPTACAPAPCGNPGESEEIPPCHKHPSPPSPRRSSRNAKSPLEAVPALAALLDNEHLSVYARYGLEPIEGPAADDALRDALARLKGVRLAGVINSIAKRRDAKAVPAITKLTQSPDPEVARAAIAALGAISGDAAARELQAALARAAAPMRATVADACLICAERLLAAGNRTRALSLYAALTAPDAPKAARLAAMNAIIAAETAANRPR
jgi:hypothetical protein